MEFQLRDKIDNQYRVTEKHFGGMSVVYIVLDEFSQRRFAVKTLKQELLEDRTAISRFSAEARTWMNLGRHENIVEAIIYREIEGQPFLFLEYIEGANLQVLIDSERQLFPPQLTRFMLQVCAAMIYVHNARVGPGEMGVIHRDIKPANIMLTREAVVKITDFGLAKTYGMPSEHSDVGVGLGTYLYMPPEQLLDASSADRTSDVYAFGVAYYTAITGRPPIQGKNAGQVVRNILSQEPVRPGQLVGGVPPELEDIIMRCLAKQREERFQSFEELRTALLAAQEVVDATHAGRDDIRTCRGCGYVTTYSHQACPICANSFEAGQPAAPEAAGAPTTEPEPEPEPELEAVQILLQTAREWKAKDDLQRAVNVLRQAMAIAPGHVEARRELDALVLEAAPPAPRVPQPSPTTGRCSAAISRAPATRPSCWSLPCSAAGSTRLESGFSPLRPYPTVSSSPGDVRTSRPARGISWRCRPTAGNWSGSSTPRARSCSAPASWAATCSSSPHTTR